MKFDTKYLIRWGIPGWLMVFWLVYTYAVLKGINPLETSSSDLTNSITLLISLTALGVPVGYVMHQLYFGVLWVLNLKSQKFDDFMEAVEEEKAIKPKDWEKFKSADKYFHLEYVWHYMLMEQEDEVKRPYLEGRYRHILGTIHGLGALFVSSVVSLLGSVFIAFYYSFGETNVNIVLFVAGAVIQVAIFLASVANYAYFSKNLRALQIKMLKRYL
ncbi:hypothetical protein [Halobacillus kuroshimensis]|uniref:hypothetical protein n=1 Tax=Halobacillus kuroshimensis TaxID=302481 RepID=UPI00041E105E|nr:hypothetical protein [Halobacillus kuroshimensis]